MSLKHNFQRGTASSNVGRAGLCSLSPLFLPLSPPQCLGAALLVSSRSLVQLQFGLQWKVHLLQPWMARGWGGWGDELPSQGLLWGTEQQSSSASWRIQLGSTTLAFSAAITIIRMTWKHRNCSTGCSFELQMALGVARRSLPTGQRSCREKNLQEDKSLERPGAGWERRLFSTYFSQELSSL